MKFTRGCILVLALLLTVACSPPRGVYHTVGKGQTLYQISKTYRVNESYLARINGISDPTRLAVGQRIFIPGATSTRYVPATVSTQKPVVKKVKPRPVAPSKPKPVVKKTRTKAASSGKKRPGVQKPGPSTRTHVGTGVGRGFFVWPQRGRIVRSFGSRNGKVCNGIEIAMPAGSAVASAAAGRVIYSGNGISGYGNLIVVQHEKDYYSVYGYNRKNLVKTGSFVSKGQKLALSGVAPSGGTPRLYFEIRHGKKPVNPLTLLP
ncbi:MAG: M23 family metallopeptidase [Deltaproteobacteria bacterium]|nr:MAG: M23 family metallopeptidase [Deltaproteobacteria bacterium]